MRVDIIPIDSITVGKRFRENLGDIEGLTASIREKGLINPLTVYCPQDVEITLLMAGGRRYAAAKLAGLTDVPVRIYHEPLSELELRSIELEENVQRKDLDWIEHVNLQREIHNLRQSIHGVKVSTSPDATGWSLHDTAKLLGKSVAGLSMDVKLANAVETMPDLEWNECRNKHEAMKLLGRIEEAAIKSELAKRAGLVVGGLGVDGHRKRIMDSFVVGDFFDKVKGLDSGMFNLIEVDPPYGIDLAHVKRKKGVSIWSYAEDGYNEISAEGYPQFISGVLHECYRVMAENSWLLLWGGTQWLSVLHEMLSYNGFKATSMFALWTKPNGQTNQPNIRLANAYELFIYASKGSPMLAKPGTTNVFHHSQVAAQNKIHPTERPISLMLDIIQTFAFGNSRVLVPFAGSGTTLIAAQMLGMHAIGFDLTQEYKDSFDVRVMQMDI